MISFLRDKLTGTLRNVKNAYRDYSKLTAKRIANTKAEDDDYDSDNHTIPCCHFTFIPNGRFPEGQVQITSPEIPDHLVSVSIPADSTTTNTSKPPLISFSCDIPSRRNLKELQLNMPLTNFDIKFLRSSSSTTTATAHVLRITFSDLVVSAQRGNDLSLHSSENEAESNLNLRFKVRCDTYLRENSRIFSTRAWSNLLVNGLQPGEQVMQSGKHLFISDTDGEMRWELRRVNHSILLRPDAYQRIVTEFARLNHSVIPRIRGALKYQNRVYLVQKTSLGESVASFLQQAALSNQQLTFGQINNIIYDLLDMLDCLHSNGFMHSALTAHEVYAALGNFRMIPSEPSTGCIFVTGFEHMKHVETMLRRRVDMVVSPSRLSYASPEELEGVYSYPADIWAVAIILLELLGLPNYLQRSSTALTKSSIRFFIKDATQREALFAQIRQRYRDRDRDRDQDHDQDQHDLNDLIDLLAAMLVDEKHRKDARTLKKYAWFTAKQANAADPAKFIQADALRAYASASGFLKFVEAKLITKEDILVLPHSLTSTKKLAVLSAAQDNSVQTIQEHQHLHNNDAEELRINTTYTQDTQDTQDIQDTANASASASASANYESVHQLLRFYDTSGSGKLNLQDFTRVCQYVGISRSEAVHLFVSCDLDADGWLDISEMILAFKPNPFSIWESFVSRVFQSETLHTDSHGEKVITIAQLAVLESLPKNYVRRILKSYPSDVLSKPMTQAQLILFGETHELTAAHADFSI